MQCPFCQIMKHQADAHIIHETENIIAFLDVDPINEGHVLIIPKLHEASLEYIPQYVLNEIIQFLQRMSIVLKNVYHADGYSIMQNGGEFCDFGHAHFHIFPRYKNDGFSWKYSDDSFEYSLEIASKLKIALNDELC